MPYVLLTVLLLAGVALLVYGQRRLAMSRIVSGQSTTRIGSATSGLVAFRGKVVPITTLRSPHSGKECVYFDVLEEEWVEGDRFNPKKRGGEWRTLRHDVNAVDFLIADDSGTARVAPEGAEWHLRVDTAGARSTAAPSQGVQVSFGSRIASDKRRTTETYVLPGDALHVIGQARPGDGGRFTVSREGAAVFVITDKPRGALLESLRTTALLASGGGVLFALIALGGFALLAMNPAGPARAGGDPPRTPPDALAHASSTTTPPAAGAVTTSGHCRDVAAPSFDTIRALGGRSSSDLWVAGDRGMLAHCDGTSWKVRHVGENALRAIALRQAGGVFAVGDRGTALAATRDAATPIAVSSTAGLWSVWTGPDGYGWAVGGLMGPTQTIGKDGVSFAHRANVTYYSIDKPVLLRVQNDRWVDVPQGGRNTLRSVWGASSSDVWAGGDNGTLMQWDGRMWMQRESPTQQTIESITGSGSFAMFLSHVHYQRQGARWSQMPGQTWAGGKAWAASDASAWTVEMTGEVRHWNGTDWTTQRAAPGLSRGSAAIHGFSDADLWIATGTRLEHWNGATWK